MKLAIVMDGRFEWHNGQPYSSHMAFDPFVTRFLKVFDEVEIYARAYDIAVPTGKSVTGPGASFVRLGDYRGFRQFLRQLFTIVPMLFRLASRPEPVIAYLPGTLPLMFAIMRLMMGRPIHSLVVADPADQLSSTSLRHPLRVFARAAFIRLLKFVLCRSCSAMFVTKAYLQSRYPVGPHARTFATSDVYIPPDAFALSPRIARPTPRGPKSLIYVAMMAQAYKGHDDLISAFALAKLTFPDIHLKLVGDGPLRGSIEQLVKDFELSESVEFTGKLGHGKPLIEALDNADLFVMSSRAEGLPRVLVEAMARGLPVVSTNVGGISELLEPQYLVEPDKPRELANLITSVLQNSEELSAMSRKNLTVAQNFRSDIIEESIIGFYSHIRDVEHHEA